MIAQIHSQVPLPLLRWLLVSLLWYFKQSKVNFMKSFNHLFKPGSLRASDKSKKVQNYVAFSKQMVTKQRYAVDYVVIFKSYTLFKVVGLTLGQK